MSQVSYPVCSVLIFLHLSGLDPNLEAIFPAYYYHAGFIVPLSSISRIQYIEYSNNNIQLLKTYSIGTLQGSHVQIKNIPIHVLQTLQQCLIFLTQDISF